jgi:hypothetical protein
VLTTCQARAKPRGDLPRAIGHFRAAFAKRHGRLLAAPISSTCYMGPSPKTAATGTVF